MWQDLAEVSGMYDKDAVRFACCSGFFLVSNVFHVIYAAWINPIPDIAAQLQHVESQLEAVRALLGERQGLRGAADHDAALGLAGRRQAGSDEGPVARFDVEREQSACDCRPVGRLRS